MPITLHWENEEKHILRCNMIGQWTSQELLDVIEAGQHYFTNTSQVVHLIFDWSRNTQTPTRIIEFARRAENYAPPNFGLLVMVGANAFIQSLMLVVQKLAPKTTRNLYYADTIAEAHILINSQSQTSMLSPVP